MWDNKRNYFLYIWKQIVLLVVGTFVMAVAVVCYFDQIGVVAGGVTGLAIIFERLWYVPMWIVNLLFNIPLFLIGYRVFEKRILGRMIAGTVLLTVFLGIIPSCNILTGDLLVDVIVGSVLMGLGLGFVFLGQASTGGVDLLSTIINRRVRYISIPKIMGLLDG